MKQLEESGSQRETWIYVFLRVPWPCRFGCTAEGAWIFQGDMDPYLPEGSLAMIPQKLGWASLNLPGRQDSCFSECPLAALPHQSSQGALAPWLGNLRCIAKTWTQVSPRVLWSYHCGRAAGESWIYQGDPYLPKGSLGTSPLPHSWGILDLPGRHGRMSPHCLPSGTTLAVWPGEPGSTAKTWIYVSLMVSRPCHLNSAAREP